MLTDSRDAASRFVVGFEVADRVRMVSVYIFCVFEYIFSEFCGFV